MIYFDNAATSYPKPVSVINAVNKSFLYYAANPGRGGHKMSVETAEKVFETRQIINDFFNGNGAEFVCFTSNCTQGLNTAINGLVNVGDHIVISCFEHNSVLRPVHLLKHTGVADYSVFNVGTTVDETLFNFKNAIKINTRLCVITAVSNVFGDVLPIKQIAKITKEKGITLIVDGAQGAGIIPIDVKGWGIDCLCVPGHKGLLGPMGTGAIILNGINPDALMVGGTGTSSKSVLQPDAYPEKLESGTLNVPGICGLCEGVKKVNGIGVNNVFKQEKRKCQIIADELQNIEGVKVYLPQDKAVSCIISFNVKNMHSESVAMLLSQHNIAVRGGFHCSPLAHKFMGTDTRGAVRVSPSYFTTKKDINILLNLIRKIAF